MFSRMNIIFFSDAGNVTFNCIFSGRDYLCFFWQKGNIIFVTFIHIYRKYHTSMYFWSSIIFNFPSKEEISYFREKRNTIFPDITKKIIFNCQFFGKTIFFRTFEENIIFLCIFFWERSSSLSRLKDKIISSVTPIADCLTNPWCPGVNTPPHNHLMAPQIQNPSLY